MTANAPATATDATVCIPYRPGPGREEPFSAVATWWKDNGFTVVVADTEHQPFNLSAARNAAVRLATTDMVIVADADTIPERASIDAALTVAALGGVVYPFTEYRYLAASVTPGDELATAPTERSYPESVGGMLVCRRDLYWALGGMDEAFTEWGGEDRAFELVARNLSTITRIPGAVYAFNHEADRNMHGAWRLRLREYIVASRRGRIEDLIAR